MSKFGYLTVHVIVVLSFQGFVHASSLPYVVSSTSSPLSATTLRLVLSLVRLELATSMWIRRVTVVLLALLVPSRHGVARFVNLPTGKLRIAPSVTARGLGIGMLSRCLVRLAAVVAGLIWLKVTPLRRLRRGRRLVRRTSGRV